MNRIDTLFQTKKKDILSIYFTAGYPLLSSTAGIIKDLAGSGADMIEIGIPFSDPLADGPVIQKSSQTALKNGMSITLLFKQLADIRKEVSVPLILMGYVNPVLKFGIEKFCKKCREIGIDGLILPDLPPEIYMDEYPGLFEKYDLSSILLISPKSPDERIRMIDRLSTGFIYMVSSSSTTGTRAGFTEDQLSYFRRIKGMNLKKPRLIGFGISDPVSFNQACETADGAIIGSAFIKMLDSEGSGPENINQFIRKITGLSKEK